ncbi:MAG: deoxyhypusine synthase family protein [Planctomycetes bacterium]|nr:deoxyhypusine synthase family protein [Planctomycetota bacterium]
MALMRFREQKVRPLDPREIRSIDGLCRALAGCGFQGRKLARCVDVWEAMVKDRECVKVFTFSGAMVPAGMGEVAMRLVEARAVDAIVSTGANVTHDFVNAVVDQGHYLGSEHEDDDQLREHRTNRIFDVYIPEDHYESGENFLLELLEREGVRERRFSTAELTRFLGERLERRCLLSVAARAGVPVFVPAASDSELGIALAVYRKRNAVDVSFDEVSDIERYAGIIRSKPRCGCVVVGGGVPRNWAQQVFPYLDVLARTLPGERSFEGFSYGVRITTDRPDFGGLSGCTFEESKSWGKYGAHARFESVVCDATIALPVIACALLERLGAKGAPSAASGAGSRAP